MSDILTRVISLPDSQERRARFTRDNPDFGDWQFFDGRKTVSAPLTYDPGEALALGGRRLTAGELGCYASHYAVWQELADHPSATHAIIFEDDVVIDERFFGDFRDLARRETPIGLFRFFTAFPPVPGRISHNFVGRYALIESRTPIYGMAAYALDRQTAGKLLAALVTILEPIDLAVDAYWRHGVVSKTVFPSPVFHRHGGTEIEESRFDLDNKPPAAKFRRAVKRIADAFSRVTWPLRQGKHDA